MREAIKRVYYRKVVIDYFKKGDEYKVLKEYSKASVDKQGNIVVTKK